MQLRSDKSYYDGRTGLSYTVIGALDVESNEGYQSYVGLNKKSKRLHLAHFRAPDGLKKIFKTNITYTYEEVAERAHTLISQSLKTIPQEESTIGVFPWKDTAEGNKR